MTTTTGNGLSKNAIIERLFLSKNFNDAIGKMQPAHLQDDLKMEVISIVCEWPEEKIIKLHTDNALEFYTVRVILNQAKSSTSPFAKTYRQPTPEIKKEPVQPQTEELEERAIREAAGRIAMEELDKLYWYDAEMLRIYLRVGSFRAMEKDTGIPFISCYKNVKKSLKILAEKNIKQKAEALFSKDELRFIQNQTK